MMMFYVFKSSKGIREIESPGLGEGDVERLKELFPDNLIWKSSTTDVGNIYLPTDDQAKALYDALVEHYCVCEVSDEKYPTDDSGAFFITSDLLSVFNELISFFEKEFGFKKSEDAERIIAAKQKAHAEQMEVKRREFKVGVLKVFSGLPDFRKPKDAVFQQRLRKKLAEYHTRLAKSLQHPELAMAVDETYRCTAYRMEVLTSVLALNEDESLNLKEMVERAIEKYRDGFDASGYYSSCGVIAYYLGNPFPGSNITKELPQAEVTA